MRRWLASALVAAACAQLIPASGAHERILDFASDIALQPEGGLLVTETIAVQVEGQRIKRGIFRDFPTRYQDRRGANVIVPFDVVSVHRDGEPENYRVEPLDNGVRVRIGRAEHLLPPGAHEYRIVYRSSRQLGFFERHDELYWNVTGNGWEFAIEHASARVRLPQAVPADRLSAEAYTGPQGARGREASASVATGEFIFETTRTLGPNEGLTIVAAFPKGIFAAPSETQRLAWIIGDNSGELIAIGAVLAIIAFLFTMWWRIGRDPRAGPKFPRYDAPAGMSPAAVRFVDNMKFDTRCLAAAIVGLGARGFLKVQQSGDAFAVQKTGRTVDWLAGDKPMADALFGSGTHATLTQTYDPAVAGAQKALAGALRRHYKGTIFRINSWPLWLAVIVAVAALAYAGGVGAQPILLVALAAIVLMSLMVFARLMPAYTPEGRRVQDHIEGLRQYLGVAERDDLARMKTPEMTPAEFARMLPYALALDVERTWADRFATVLGAAAVAAAVSSYYDGDSDFWSSGSSSNLANSLDALGSTVSSASTPPGSASGGSSGGGGGGSSGGGGGGGGGGGW
jgi:uncharacterized membrane protein YgcG